MKPKLNHAGNLYVPQGVDACQTPAYALQPLFPYLPLDWTVWEPAAGEGYIVRTLADQGYKVTGSDLLTGKNFFSYAPMTDIDCIVTNPPYSIKYRWIAHCYALNLPFALLMPVETLGASSAQVLFAKHGIEIIFLNRRVNFKMPNKGFGGSAQFPVAWFTHGLNIGKQISFARINNKWSPGQGVQLEMFGEESENA